MAFKDKSIAILIADPASGVRPAMAGAMRELGFDKITSVDSLAEALNIIATDPIGWLITSIFPDTKVNALQILKLARQQQQLQNLKVSIFAAEEEQPLLPKAFSLGLFSCHGKPFNKDSFQNEMAEVLKSLETNNWNPTLTSAEYLRPILKAQNLTPALLKFEQNLNQMFPEEAGLLLHLAEAHFLNKNIQAGRTLLWQATQRQPELADHVRDLSERYLDNEADATDASWDLGTCVVVDPDSAAQVALQEALKSCAAKEVQIFDNGERCWEWLKANGEPDLLVMEWRLHGLSGPSLLQRCRSQGFHKVSIVVHSSLVQRQDEPLLREMGVTEIMPKPFRREDFLNGIAATVGQWQCPTEFRALEAKIRALLASNDLAEATNHMQLYLTKCGAGRESSRAQLEAEFAFSAGNYQVARDMAIKSMRLGNKSVTLLNLLGKALMRLREFAAALKIFQRANDIAPNSVARLCAMAETQQELGDTVAAKNSLGLASTLDPSNQDVINAKVNIGMATGDQEMVQQAINHFRPTDNILAYVNNKAVAHSRAGEFDSGIQLYMNALSTIPPENKRLHAIIGYNLALAQVRKKDIVAAITALETIPALADDPLARKIASLLARARTALAKGKPMQVFTEGAMLDSSTPIEQNASKLIGQFQSSDATASTACCHGLYIDERPDSETITALLANPPAFRIREAIVKG